MKKQTVFRLVSVCIVPLLTIIIIEGLLTVAGYKNTYEVEDPFLGFQGHVPVFEFKPANDSKAPGKYVTRRSKLPYFNDQEFPAEKSRDEFRIFTFGGSTTYGRPYTGETSFSRWLEINLQVIDPGTKYRVINVGGVSYASYRIINLMLEMVQYGPDLFVVYTGHNEFLEDRTYESIREGAASTVWLRRNLNRMKFYTLLRKVWLAGKERDKQAAEAKFQMTGEVNAILDQSFGLNWYHKDPDRDRAIRNHFEINLRNMVDIAAYHKIPMVFIVPPSNEKDFSPFKSEHAAGRIQIQIDTWENAFQSGLAHLRQKRYWEALQDFNAASQIDSGYAALSYRMGECYLGLGEYGAAKGAFVQARDLDVAPLRATSRIQNIVRKVAHDRNTLVIDLASIFEAANQKRFGHAILGEEVFLDHAHLTIERHQAVAQYLVQLMTGRGYVKPINPLSATGRTALYDSLMAEIDSSYFGQRDLNLAKVLDWAGKVEESEPFIRRAARALPDNPEAQYGMGLLYQRQKKYAEAEQAFEGVLQLDSTYADAYNSLGSIYDMREDLDQALKYYSLAVKYNPVDDKAYFNMGGILYEKGRIEEAVEAYSNAIKSNPRHIFALNDLGATYMELNRIDKAIIAFEKLIDIEPRYYNAYNNLGMIYFQQGDFGKSRDMLERSLKVKPDNEFAEYWLELLNASSPNNQ